LEKREKMSEVSEKDFREWRVSCSIFTVWVKTAGKNGTKIIDGAPIIRKWIGQNFHRFVAYYQADVKSLD